MNYKNNIPSLNFVRLLCMAGIILFHVHVFFGDPFNSVLRLVYKYGGGVGNGFFFISSGFLLSLHHTDLILARKENFASFFYKRLSAIYPLYFLSNLVQLGLLFVTSGLAAWNVSRIVLSFLFVTEGWVDRIEPPNYPTWFICVLILCYLLYYGICAVSRNRTCFRVLICVMILWGYICRTGILEVPFCYSLTGTSEMDFFIGCLLAELLFYTEKLRRPFYIFLGVGSILLLVGSFRRGFLLASGDYGLLLCVIIIPLVLLVCCKSYLFN